MAIPTDRVKNACEVPIYEKLGKLYAGQGLGTLFFHYRWLVFPHKKVLGLVPPKGKIYDIGCGYGISSNYLAIFSPDREVIGVERDDRRYAAAARTQGEYNNVRFVHGDINALEVERCDGIVLNDVLHHLSNFEEQEELLARCYRWLRNGGTLLISDINDKPFWKFAIAFLVDHLYYRRWHIPYRNAQSLEALLRRIGFTVETFYLDQGVPFSSVVYLAKKSASR